MVFPISCCVHAPPQIYYVYVLDVASGAYSNQVAITFQAATTTTSVQSSTTTSYSTTITAPPTISLSPSSLPSTGGQVQFTASRFTPNGPIQFNVQGPTPFYSFSWQATANSNGQTVFNYNMQALISGTYSVTATDSVSGLASNSAQFTIAQVATTTASSSRVNLNYYDHNHYALRSTRNFLRYEFESVGFRCVRHRIFSRLNTSCGSENMSHAT